MQVKSASGATFWTEGKWSRKFTKYFTLCFPVVTAAIMVLLENMVLDICRPGSFRASEVRETSRPLVVHHISPGDLGWTYSCGEN